MVLLLILLREKMVTQATEERRGKGNQKEEGKNRRNFPMSTEATS